MRAAVLYDIHGNLPALDAVLAEIREIGVDFIVIGGDVVPGPMPRETLDRLRRLELPVRAIRGNGERVVLARHAGAEVSEVPPAMREVVEWNAGQLTPDDAALLESWPATREETFGGLGKVLFCHATPRSDVEIFTRRTAEDRLRPVFAGVDAALAVCGHTHMQFDRRVGALRVVNAGSVGMPFAAPAGAYWLMLGPDPQLRRTEYDVTDAAARIRQSSCPQVEAISVRYVLQPPSEEETLARFGAVELA